MATPNANINADWYTLQAQQPLDPDLLDLNDAETAFFKAQTGINDDDALRAHILEAQRKAFAVFPYPCIRRFAFAKLKISRHPGYQEVVKLGKERPGAILLELGCCFGNDARKAVADGFPGAQVIASDIEAEFWALGHDLFRDSDETCAIRFIQGDVFSDAFIHPAAPPDTADKSRDPIAECVAHSNLDALRGRVSAIHASSFFHLFNEAQQIDIARRCNALLSSEPGSIIFGSHGGLAVAGSRPGGREAYLHSPESWKKMWAEVVPDGSVVVEAQLFGWEYDGTKREGFSPEATARDGGWLVWAVRRV